MDSEKEKILIERYSDIFQDYHKSINESAMAWGILCGNGWFHIIDNLCHDLTSLTKNKNIQVIADQVKEKFGGLRFYYSLRVNRSRMGKFWSLVRNFCYKKRWGRQYNFLRKIRQKVWKSIPEKIDDLITEAEIQSIKTCEDCGKPGKRIGDGWVRTICPECHIKSIQHK